MASILQEKKLFLVWSENFFFFIWELEESDLKYGNIITSSKFNLRGEKVDDSYLKIEVNGHVYLSLYNAVAFKGGHFMIIISDELNSVIYSHTKSCLDAQDKNDLLQNLRSIPSGTKYPITITCISKYDKEDVSREPQMISPDLVLFNSLKELSSDFKKTLEQNTHSDIVLDVEGENIQAHKLILQARSPVFHKMFDKDSLEAAENKVAISDIGAAAMKNLLNYLYTGTVETCGFEENIELYCAACKYEMLSLRNICTMRLLKLIEVDNACSLFALAIRHCDEDLKQRVVVFIGTNFKSVINAESFTELSKCDMALLMRLCVSAMC